MCVTVCCGGLGNLASCMCYGRCRLNVGASELCMRVSRPLTLHGNFIGFSICSNSCFFYQYILFDMSIETGVISQK